MAEDRLLSILQVSDLHFGALLANGDADLPPGLGQVPWMSGQLGHHRRAAKDLHRFVAERRDRGEAEILVVSGDLTATGAVLQFDLARSFLGSAPPHPAFPFTLGAADWTETGVSGNHDQWPGSGLIVGPATPGLAATFPYAFPFARSLQRGRGPKVTFVMVDSDADVGPVSLDRVLGRGKFVSQLEKLADVLPDWEDGEIRVMVIHHSIADAAVPAVPGATAFPRPGPRPPRALEIAPESLLALEHALVDHSISVVMTGHLHVPRLTEFRASNGIDRRPVFETRCGTTTQRDAYPYRLLPRTQGLLPLDPLPPNTLVMHDLVRRDEALFWKAEVHWRAPGRGFVAGVRSVSKLLPGIMKREMAL